MSDYKKKYVTIAFLNGNTFVYASIVFLLIFSASCRSARYLEEGQSLVTKSQIEGLPSELEEEAGDYIQPGIRPNSRLNFFLYNLANARNGRYKTNNIRKIGEAPRLLDSSLVELSTLQINRFLFNKGYFDAQVNNVIEHRGKKSQITFHVDEGRPYYINSVATNINDPSVTALYLSQKHRFSTLRPGTRFDADSMAAERENIYYLMRRNGYFDYVRQYMTLDVDTTAGPAIANVRVNIENPEGATKHLRYRIDSSFVRVLYDNPSRNRTNPRIRHLKDGVIVEDYTGRFSARPLMRYLFQRQHQHYNLDLENLSYDRLYELNSFKRVAIDYSKKGENQLNVNYELTPRSYMSNQLEGEYTFSAGMSGFNVGSTFSHRNLFGGSESLDIKLQYGVLFDSRLPGQLLDRVFNNDFQIGVNISLPHLLTPFDLAQPMRYGLPKTVFTSNLQVFDQAATYSNRYLVNTLSYHWFSARNRQHQFTPIVLEYRSGQLNEQFAEELIDKGYLLYVRSNNRAYFGLGSQYVFTYNANQLLQPNSFLFFRGAVELSGNLLDLAGRVFSFDENIDGEKEVFGAPYLQFAKLEGDIRYYKQLGGDQQLVFRINPGIALPYGNNSSLLIFEKSFFGGGMNGMRAWQARTLGPGSYNREDLDPSLRMNFRNLDQLGELKLEANAEYRFKILNNLWGAKVKGATFADLGNIWRIRESELNPGGEFKLQKFWSHIAIGAGAGLRFDLDYFILRLDVGAKVKDPQFEAGEQWMIKKWFNGREFKENYSKTHAPDNYRFLQYNFGIGLPF